MLKFTWSEHEYIMFLNSLSPRNWKCDDRTPTEVTCYKISCLCDILDGRVNSRDRISIACPPHTLHLDTPPSSMLPSQFMWSCFLLACHSHNLRSISVENTCVLFTLGTRCNFCYSCSQFSASLALSRDDKGIFKSISNNNTKSSVECEVHLNCHHFQIHSEMEQ